jgi:sulfur-oxidizing protein SoxZ
VANARIEVPATAKRGEIIEIRTLIRHDMETGFRRTNLGVPVPRDIISQFWCIYNGVEICRVDLHPSVAANPYISFSTIATESGTLVFNWSGDNGFTASESVSISVV